MSKTPTGDTGNAAIDRDRLLATKLSIPSSRPERLTRARLAAALESGVNRKLVLVCTPPGFGKTTLVAEWARGAKWPIAWLSLDPDDNDPARFWRYVVAAFDRAGLRVGDRVLTLLDAPGVVSGRGLVTALINEIEDLSDDVALILDDYHVIESSVIHDDVTFLLSHLPPQLHVVISSRSDPPFPLASLRAAGSLAELRAADLRFTSEESAALMGEVWGLNLSGEAVATLESKTEGWAVGLQLAALSLRGRTDPDEFLNAFAGTHRFILDYLSEEVLKRQPDRVRKFLLQSSILERLSGPLCDAVTAGADGQDRLEEVERANLFLVPLDEERRWYRFHHLFRDLLVARLQQSDPEIVPELHRRAAAWCEQHGLIDDAIRHALSSGDASWAARLVEEHLDQSFHRGETAILARWLSLLPGDTVRSVSALCLAQGLMQFHLGHLDAVERLAEHAERAFDPRRAPPSHGVPTIGGMVADVPAAIALLRSELAAGRGDAEGTAVHARSALARIAVDEEGPRLWARWLLACAEWIGGRSAEAERAFTVVLTEGRATPGAYPEMATGSTLARVQRARGKLGAALRTYQEALRFVSESGRLSRYHAGEPHVGIAQVLYERNELADSLRHLSEGIGLCRHVIVLTERDRGLATLAWIRRARGEADAAFAAIDEACAMYPGPDVVSLFRRAPSERARLLLAQGRIDEARRWTEQRGLTDEDEVSYARERDYLVLVRVLLARSEPARALGLLTRLEALAESQDRSGSVIEIRALRALALQAAGDHDAALVTLTNALSLARPEGHIRVFVDEGPRMAALLRGLINASTRGGSPSISRAVQEHLHRVVRAFEPPKADDARASMSALVEPLTKRELEVLSLVAAGRRNREIADELVVTLETIKKHVSHIFDKLGATNRTEAVNQARELGLIA
jgi:LuxR family transcriptional regulator, maltose regulon positive regulatory protein